MVEFLEIKETQSVGSFVEISSPELLWLAESGQPYRGTLYIQFISNGRTVDMLSLKRYITSLRQQKFLLEDIADVIYEKLSGLENLQLGVTVKTTARGGISSTIRAGVDFRDPESKPIVFGIK